MCVYFFLRQKNNEKGFLFVIFISSKGETKKHFSSNNRLFSKFLKVRFYQPKKNCPNENFCVERERIPLYKKKEMFASLIKFYKRRV